MLVVGCVGIARQGAAMFVNPPKKEVVPSTPAENATSPTPKKTEPTQTKEPAPSPDIRLDDIKLRNQLLEIAPVPVEERKVNSNTFSRMSGQTEHFRPVAVPASSVESGQGPPPGLLDDPLEPREKIFVVGSWAFILACVGAAAIGLLRIKKLTSSQ